MKSTHHYAIECLEEKAHEINAWAQLTSTTPAQRSRMYENLSRLSKAIEVLREQGESQ